MIRYTNATGYTGAIWWARDIVALEWAYSDPATPDVVAGTLQRWTGASLKLDGNGGGKSGEILLRSPPPFGEGDALLRLLVSAGNGVICVFAAAAGNPEKTADYSWRLPLIGLHDIEIDTEATGVYPAIDGITTGSRVLFAGDNYTPGSITTYRELLRQRYALYPEASWGVGPDLFWLQGRPQDGAPVMYNIDHRARVLPKGASGQEYITHVYADSGEMIPQYRASRLKPKLLPSRSQRIQPTVSKAPANKAAVYATQNTGAFSIGGSGVAVWRCNLRQAVADSYPHDPASNFVLRGLEVVLSTTWSAFADSLVSWGLWIGTTDNSGGGGVWPLGESGIYTYPQTPPNLWAGNHSYVKPPTGAIRKLEEGSELLLGNGLAYDGAKTVRFVLAPELLNELLANPSYYLTAMLGVSTLSDDGRAIYRGRLDGGGNPINENDGFGNGFGSIQFAAPSASISAEVTTANWTNPPGLAAPFSLPLAHEVVLPAFVLPPILIRFGELDQYGAGVDVQINPQLGVQSTVATQALPSR